jgi:hypothetical protein
MHVLPSAALGHLCSTLGTLVSSSLIHPGHRRDNRCYVQQPEFRTLGDQ